MAVKIDERGGRNQSAAIDMSAVRWHRRHVFAYEAVQDDDIAHAIAAVRRIDDPHVVQHDIQGRMLTHSYTAPGRNPAASAASTDEKNSRFSGRMVAAHRLRAGWYFLRLMGPSKASEVPMTAGSSS